MSVTPTTQPPGFQHLHHALSHAGAVAHHWAPAAIAVVVAAAGGKVWWHERQRYRKGRRDGWCKAAGGVLGCNGDKIECRKERWDGRRPRLARFHYPAERTHAAGKPDTREALAQVFNDLWGGPVTVTPYPQTHDFLVERKPVEPTVAPAGTRPAKVLEGKPGLVPFGGTATAARRWDQGGSQPHMLIGGETGAGKTELLYTLAVERLHRGGTVVLVDGKGFDLMDLRDLPGVERYAREPADWAEAISAVYHENQRRKQAVWESGDRATAAQAPWLTLFVDEFVDVMAALKGTPAAEHLASLLGTGRQTKVSCCLSTLSPEVEKDGLTGRMRRQFGCRVLLGPVKDTAMHTMMFGRKAPPLTTVRPGQFVMVGPHGDFIEDRTWLIPANTRAALLPASPPRLALPVPHGTSGQTGQDDRDAQDVHDARDVRDDDLAPTLTLVKGGKDTPTETLQKPSTDGRKHHPSVDLSHAPKPPAEWLPSSAVCDRLGISPGRLSQLTRSKRLNPRPRGGKGRALEYDPGEVDRVLREQGKVDA